jgi:nitrogen-specific signal transduction histidine kinase
MIKQMGLLKQDAPKLEMAILNILLNAIEAVPDNTGLIEVETVYENKQAQLLNKRQWLVVSALKISPGFLNHILLPNEMVLD